MKKVSKSSKSNRKDYVYIRLDKEIKGKLKRISSDDGSNMTIWIRQLIIKTLECRS